MAVESFTWFRSVFVTSVKSEVFRLVSERKEGSGVRADEGSGPVLL